MVSHARDEDSDPGGASGPGTRRIRVGIGGWTYAPWRNNFYPEAWPQAKELEYASRALSAIEINATYHGTQKPTSFAKWRDETPDDFVFSVKASRFATNRKLLAEGRESIDRFIGSGLSELRAKLGPIVWQFMPAKRYEPDDFERFLECLPKLLDGVPLRHVLDVRHASFMTPEYLALARRYRCATVLADSDDYPSFADLTGDFVYARLMRSDASLPSGYAAPALDRWAQRAKEWVAGGEPGDLFRVEHAPSQPPSPATPTIISTTVIPTKVGIHANVPPAPAASKAPRDVFLFVISGAKERAPAAAMELLKRLA